MHLESVAVVSMPLKQAIIKQLVCKEQLIGTLLRRKNALMCVLSNIKQPGKP